jgi:hypothetical protein
MLQLDFKDLESSVSEYQKRQRKLITAVAWMLTKQGVSTAAALRSLGIKPTPKWTQEVSSFGFGREEIEK